MDADLAQGLAMSEQLESGDDLSDLPEIPDPPVGSGAMPDLGPPISDDEALGKMKRRSSFVAILAGIVLLLGAVAVAAFFYLNQQNAEHARDEYNAAQAQARACTASEEECKSAFLARLRQILPEARDADVKRT